MTLLHTVAKGSTGTKNRLVFMAFPRSWPQVAVIHAHSSPIKRGRQTATPSNLIVFRPRRPAFLNILEDALRLLDPASAMVHSRARHALTPISRKEYANRKPTTPMLKEIQTHSGIKAKKSMIARTYGEIRNSAQLITSRKLSYC